MKYFANTQTERALYVKCGRGIIASVKSALLDKGFEEVSHRSSGDEIARMVLDSFDILILDDIHAVADAFNLYWIKGLYDHFNMEKQRSLQIIMTSTESWLKFSQRGRPIPEMESRYHFAIVAFGHYHAQEVGEILKQRAELVFGELSEEQIGALNFVAGRSRDGTIFGLR